MKPKNEVVITVDKRELNPDEVLELNDELKRIKKQGFYYLAHRLIDGNIQAIGFGETEELARKRLDTAN